MESLQSQRNASFQPSEMNNRNKIVASSPRSVVSSSSSTTRRHRTSISVVSAVLLLATCVDSFSPRYAFLNPSKQQTTRSAPSTTSLSIFAPPGSGYSRPEDEESVLPDTYEPMMEYPGTMRPGRTPENMPFQDLPIGDDDPDPVPWPHFQQIEWHHQWEPPHEHPIPMEDFIEMNGRWATAEMEAAMRAGFRRDVRERREQAESEKRDIIITDDDDDEVGEGDKDPIALGDGIFGKLGSDADKALTAAATAPPIEGEIVEEEVDESSDDEGLDDFLLDLGLDAELEDAPVEESPVPPPAASTKKAAKPAAAKASKTVWDDDEEDEGVKAVSDTVDLSFKVGAAASDDDDDDDDDDEKESIKMTSNGGDTAAITVDDDSDMDLGLDDEDDMSNDDADTVPLDDYSDNDSLATEDEDIFDEGGFDFDDGDFDGGDDW